MDMIKKRLKGGSQNPIVFHDYESYIAKFQEKEKTTDDTYTPPDDNKPSVGLRTHSPGVTRSGAFYCIEKPRHGSVSGLGVIKRKG